MKIDKTPIYITKNVYAQLQNTLNFRLYRIDEIKN